MVRIGITSILCAVALYVIVQCGINLAQFHIETTYTMTHCDVMTNQELQNKLYGGVK